MARPCGPSVSRSARRPAGPPAIPPPAPARLPGLLAVPWVVVRVYVLKAKRPNRVYLRNVLPGLGPVEVGRTAGEDMTLPGGYATSLSASNCSPRPM